MKTLYSLFALLAISFASLSVAHADPAELDQSYFFTDNSTDLGVLDAAYDVWGHQNGENYSFVVTYDFATGLDLDGVVLNIWYYDETTDYATSAWAEGPGRNGGDGLSWLDGAVEIPSELTGTITVDVSFYFSDGTVLFETLTHALN